MLFKLFVALEQRRVEKKQMKKPLKTVFGQSRLVTLLKHGAKQLGSWLLTNIQHTSWLLTSQKYALLVNAYVVTAGLVLVTQLWPELWKLLHSSSIVERTVFSLVLTSLILLIGSVLYCLVEGLLKLLSSSTEKTNGQNSQ